MAILEGIQIKNFRALKDVTLGRTSYASNEDNSIALPRLVAVIGANGVGKSSLLDAFNFLGDCLTEGVEKACDKPHRGGYERLRTLGVTEPIQFELRFRSGVTDRPISYTLHIGVDINGRPVVSHERLRQRRKGQKHGQPHSFVDITDGRGYAWAGESTSVSEGDQKVPIQMHDRQVLAISSFGTLVDHPRLSFFRNFLSRWYLSYFVPQLAREPSTPGADPHLDREGKNLAKYLQFIERTQTSNFQEMLSRIARKIPGITGIKSDVTKNRQLFLEFLAEGFEDTPFFQQDMSDGTLKMLAYMLLMEDPDPAPFIGIEEPENGLHHQLLETLAQEFKNFASSGKGSQLLVTTHSPNFVDALAPEEVWLLDKDAEGYSTLTRAADIPGVRSLFDEGIPMGSLWYSNHFGGLGGTQVRANLSVMESHE